MDRNIAKHNGGGSTTALGNTEENELYVFFQQAHYNGKILMISLSKINTQNAHVLM
jgi:hypothetical protein